MMKYRIGPRLMKALILIGLGCTSRQAAENARMTHWGLLLALAKSNVQEFLRTGRDPMAEMAWRFYQNARKRRKRKRRPQIIRQCLICGNSFRGPHNAEGCSPACRQTLKHQYNSHPVMAQKNNDKHKANYHSRKHEPDYIAKKRARNRKYNREGQLARRALKDLGILLDSESEGGAHA